MSEIIKMNYGLMSDMNQTFKRGVEQLEDTLREMQSIANELEDGALLGRGGAAFTDALRNKLSPAIVRLTDKFQELAGDIQNAMGDMQDADSSSQQLF